MSKRTAPGRVVGGRGQRERAILVAVCGAALSCVAAHAQTWNGAGADNNWSTPLNWVSSAVPANNGTANLIFSGSTRTATVVTPAYAVNAVSIALTAGVNPFSFSGSLLTLSNAGNAGGIGNNDDSLATFTCPIALAGNATLTTTSTGGIALSGTTQTLSLSGSALTVSPGANGPITMDSRITGSGSLLKAGAGTASFTGASQTNAYTGPTFVTGGLLVLGRQAGSAGNSFGSSVAGALSVSGATVRLAASEQIADASTVAVNQGGTLDLQTFGDTLGTLNLNDLAQVIGTSTSALRLSPGATINFASSFTSATLSAPVDFQGATHTITAGGSAGAQLSLTGGLSATVGLYKSGVAQLIINGGTDTMGGALRIEGSSNIIAGGPGSSLNFGSVTVGATTAATGTSLTIDQSYLLGLSTVNVNRFSTLTLNSPGSIYSASAGSINLDAATIAFGGAGQSLLAFGGTVNVTNTPGGVNNCNITGAGGSLNLVNAQRTFNVAPGSTNPNGDLYISAGVTSVAGGGLTKTGTGTMSLAGSLNLGAPLIVSQGFLNINPTNGGGVPSVSLTGATLNVTSTAAGGVSPLANGANVTQTLGFLTLNGPSSTTTSLGTYSLTSGSFLMFGNGSLSATQIVSAQQPGGSIPGLAGFGSINAANGMTFNVTTATNATSGAFGDLQLALPFANNYGIVTKTGPGQLSFAFTGAPLLGELHITQGSVLLTSRPSFDGVIDVGGPTPTFVSSPVGYAGTLTSDTDIDVFTLGSATFGTESFEVLYLNGGTFTGDHTTADVLLADTPTYADGTPSTATSTLAGSIAFGDGGRLLILDPARLNLTGTLLPQSPTTNYYYLPFGTLEISGSSTTDAFTGTLSNQGGLLLLNRAGDNVTTSGTLSATGSSAIVRYLRSNQLGSGATLQVLNGASLQLGGFSDSLGELDVGGSELGTNAAVSSSIAYSPGQFALTVSTLGLSAQGEIRVPVLVTGTFAHTGGAVFSPLTVSGTYAGSGGPLALLGGATFVRAASLAGAALNIGGIADFRAGLAGASSTITFDAALGGALVNEAQLTGLASISGNGYLDNRGAWTLTQPLTLLSSTGSNVSAGNVNLAPAGVLELDALLRNTGALNLAGGFITGSGTLTNATGGAITGPGSIAATLVNQGTVIAPPGLTSLPQPTTNTGTFRLTGPTAQITGGAVLNRGRITGDGIIGNNLTNASGGRVEPSAGGVLTVGGALVNQAGATLSAPAGASLVLQGPISANAGIIIVAGGSFDTAGQPLTNAATGQLTGYGSISTGGLDNFGAVTLTGGLAIVGGPVVNEPSKNLRVQYNPAIFTGYVQNNGSLIVTTTTATFAGGGANLPPGAPPPAGPLISAPDALAGTGGTTLSAGATAISDGITQGSLIIQGLVGNPGLVQIPSREPAGFTPLTGRAVGQSVSVLGSLTLASSTPASLLANLDLADNDLILTTTSGDLIQSYIAAWYAGGARTGLGLSSSLAGTGNGTDALATLGVLTNTDGRGGALYATFDGLGVNNSAVLVKYTYLGDTNLDGTVDGADLANLIAGWDGHLTGWVNGDVNYDGSVDATDFGLLMNSLQHQGASFGDSTGGSGAVPEPSAIAGAAGAVLTTLARRRRKPGTTIPTLPTA